MSDRFDPRGSESAREEAIRTVEKNADDAWKEAALNAVFLVANTQPRLISNDVFRFVEVPREPRALGPVMRRAERIGWIEATDKFILSPAVTRHRAPVRIWRSKFFKKGTSDETPSLR